MLTLWWNLIFDHTLLIVKKACRNTLSPIRWESVPKCKEKVTRVLIPLFFRVKRLTKLERTIALPTLKKITFDSDIQIGAVCCLSMRSVSLVYHWLSAVMLLRLSVAVNTWLHSFSNFWHCSNNFLEDRWAFLKIVNNIFCLVSFCISSWCSVASLKEYKFE